VGTKITGADGTKGEQFFFNEINQAVSGISWDTRDYAGFLIKDLTRVEN
jgi:phage-related protein